MQPRQAVHVMGVDKENDGSLSSLKPAVTTETPYRYVPCDAALKL